MNIYSQKKRGKWLLMAFAVLIIGASMWYTNTLVSKIAREERNKVHTWAEAVQKRASLVKYTSNFFEKLKTEERKRVELWAEATKRLINADSSEDLTFYSEIISGNTNIPVLLCDEEGNITASINVDFNTDTVKKLNLELKKEFSVYEPIEVVFANNKNYLYYKDSKLFTELRTVLDDLIKSFISEVVINSASSPVIITDSMNTKVIAYGNVDSARIVNREYVDQMLASMKAQNKPIEIDFTGQEPCYVYYKDSFLLTQLKYYPFIQFFVIGLFLLAAYIMFSSSRKAEQNQVWVGMAKETAHQLGTPLSSLMAWVEIFKMKNYDAEMIQEIEKDIQRFDTITQRFSNIGSMPKLQNENLVKVVYDMLSYMKHRTSKNITFNVNLPNDYIYYIPLNYHLFEWVIENLIKNAIDAMEGMGKISIIITEEQNWVNVDVCDTGKGIPKSKFKTVFKPGYTSKQRGWGLGLSLSKRIIEEYHRGELFVHSSIPGKGSTFRIRLKKA